jgi:PPM family protein phosphatase
MSSAEQGTPASCPECGAPVGPDDNFCEACRAELRPAKVSGDRRGTAAACPSCPESAISPEGYCETCGRRVPSGDDHAEIDLGLVAGVTDRGLRHQRNEDAMALATARMAGGPVALAVVCDGVSTSSRADEASKAAAQAAMDVLLGAVRTGDVLGSAAQRAFEAAQQALLALAADRGVPGNAPSATFAAAIVTSQEVTVCWLGDSRVYWLAAADESGGDGSGNESAARQLTKDDSVAQELIARGLPEADALASPAGHIVTGWIGADLSDAQPHVTTFAPVGEGVVLLCSDGLWNYEQDAAGLAGRALPAALTDPLGTAGDLVRFAIDAGGSDNITVVLIPFPPRPDAGTAAGPGQPEEAGGQEAELGETP